MEEEKEYVDDDKPRQASLVKVNRYGFAKPELNSADIVVKRRSAFEFDRQAYSILKRVLFCIFFFSFHYLFKLIIYACVCPECLILQVFYAYLHMRTQRRTSIVTNKCYLIQTFILILVVAAVIFFKKHTKSILKVAW